MVGCMIPTRIKVGQKPVSRWYMSLWYRVGPSRCVLASPAYCAGQRIDQAPEIIDRQPLVRNRRPRYAGCAVVASSSGATPADTPADRGVMTTARHDWPERLNTINKIAGVIVMNIRQILGAIPPEDSSLGIALARVEAQQEVASELQQQLAELRTQQDEADRARRRAQYTRLTSESQANYDEANDRIADLEQHRRVVERKANAALEERQRLEDEFWRVHEQQQIERRFAERRQRV
jgi:hypothetical protein